MYPMLRAGQASVETTLSPVAHEIKGTKGGRTHRESVIEAAVVTECTGE